MLLKMNYNKKKKYQRKSNQKNSGYRLIVAGFLFVGYTSTPVNAKILSNTSGEISVQDYETNYSNDELANLIEQRSTTYQQKSQSFYKSYANVQENTQSWNTTSTYQDQNHSHLEDNSYSWGATSSFDTWYSNYYNRSRVDSYRQFLEQRLGRNNVPPMSELLQTARSWSKCGASRYEVPPSYLWNNMVPTLNLYANLKKQNILPKKTVIRSVYRNPSLNRCAKGASGSKHKVNAAVDLWVPDFEYQPWMKGQVQNDICEFWLYYGNRYNFGLGIYSTGSIHLDTQKHRKWGGQYTSRNSICRVN